MKSYDPTVLLFEPDKKQNEELTGMLIGKKYRVISVRKMETALRKLFEFSPQLIICQKELNGRSGFHFFSMLNSKMLNERAPFILLLNELDKDDLAMGMELGIDGFLFPPFDAVQLDNILQKQLEKSRQNNHDTIHQLRSVFDDTPVGMFVVENKKVVDANPAFYRLIQQPMVKNKTVPVDEIFIFNNGFNHERNVKRCLNGITQHGMFRAIPLQSNPLLKFNISLSHAGTRFSGIRIIGLLFPEREEGITTAIADLRLRHRTLKIQEKAKQASELFTAREKQVLQLSAQGAPIKQIAAQLGISVRTVEKHRSNIIRKTNTANITEAVFNAKNMQLSNTD